MIGVGFFHSHDFLLKKHIISSPADSSFLFLPELFEKLQPWPLPKPHESLSIYF